MAGMRGETLLRPIVAFGIGAKAGLVDDGLVPKETSTPRAGSAVILSPMSDTEQMTPNSQTRKQEPPGRHRLDPNDLDGVASNRCVDRTFLSVQAPQGQPWFWTITAREYPPTTRSRGYSAKREQAMAEFKKQWVGRSSARNPLSRPVDNG